MIPMPMPNPAPAPIVLVAERFDNVSQFPSVTGNVEPPSFPELPGFLDRRKPEQPTPE
jgi:hypothetical protein